MSSTVNLGSILAARANLAPRNEAFIEGARRITFAEENARSDQFAKYLLTAGFKPGDRFALCCKNGIALSTAVFGAAKAGVTAVILNWRLRAEELVYAVNDSGAKGLMYDLAFSDHIDQIRTHAPTHTFLCSSESLSDADLESVISQDYAAVTLPDVDADAPAIIMYTSGTTGQPKGAVLSHANLCWAAQGISCTIRWNQDHRFLLVAPMFHIGGLTPLIVNVLKGCTTVFLADFDPARVWDTIQSERITNMMSVPVMLQAMLISYEKRPVDASSLQTITCGASAVPGALIDAYKARGIAVQQVYGITEFGGALSFWTHDMDTTKTHSQGKVVMHGQVRVVDVGTQQDVPGGQPGEIWCKGPMLFKGYWNNPKATQAAIIDDWYRTGDIGYQDGAGYLYVVDRVKDMIISGGENIYPAEIERVLAASPAVSEIAVVGRPDAKWGEIPVAYVVRRPGTAITEDELISTCKEHLASYKCIKQVHFVDVLPKNGVGKVLKRQLRNAA